MTILQIKNINFQGEKASKPNVTKQNTAIPENNHGDRNLTY
jgi:hypothetical protein